MQPIREQKLVSVLGQIVFDQIPNFKDHLNDVKKAFIDTKFNQFGELEFLSPDGLVIPLENVPDIYKGSIAYTSDQKRSITFAQSNCTYQVASYSSFKDFLSEFLGILSKYSELLKEKNQNLYIRRIGLRYSYTRALEELATHISSSCFDGFDKFKAESIVNAFTSTDYSFEDDIRLSVKSHKNNLGISLPVGINNSKLIFDVTHNSSKNFLILDFDCVKLSNFGCIEIKDLEVIVNKQHGIIKSAVDLALCCNG